MQANKIVVEFVNLNTGNTIPVYSFPIKNIDSESQEIKDMLNSIEKVITESDQNIKFFDDYEKVIFKNLKCADFGFFRISLMKI